MSKYREQAPYPVATGANTMGADEDYDYSAATQEAQPYDYSAAMIEEKDPYQAYQSQGKPPPPPAHPPRPTKTPPKPETAGTRRARNAADPLHDLEQLEELHEEAERMKALGNKHMAAQEYSRAYNAYSAALQLSPVGPSSHVFLCNRAAALLSLKRYAAAATDARRAIALAPTFGKAHARLGQSLYFLKDYEGAVNAYEEAVKYEPENQVTVTYLEKAKSKLARQHDRARRQARGDELSVAEESVTMTISNSIATDPHAAAAVVTTRAPSDQQLKVAAGRLPNEVHMGSTSLVTSPLAEEGEQNWEGQEDPDFDAAVRLQESANKLLASKNYKDAIQEYSSALFLVPDDPYLSPELHLGRAHALNGSHRHESARNDALLAIKINPSSEAYSTLAKSLFYMKDYLGAVAAFEDCMDLLPQGESLSMFDQAYLRKAEAAWQEQLDDDSYDLRSLATNSTKNTTIPKLPPPRFVPREKAINSTPTMPAMPKQWPQQSPRKASALKVGPERNVTFLSESLGIKLNRGGDGIVRVLSVSPETPSSPIARSGTIEAGDIVREAAGVDIRRPITNIMWGDTIALIKIAPRPITLVVAKELSVVPPDVEEEIRKSMVDKSLSPAKLSMSRGETKEEEDDNVDEELMIMPSPANGLESVRDSFAMANEKVAHLSAGASSPDQVSDTVDSSMPPSDSTASVSNVLVDPPDSVALVKNSTTDDIHEPPELTASSASAVEDEDLGSNVCKESGAAVDEVVKSVSSEAEKVGTVVGKGSDATEGADAVGSSTPSLDEWVEVGEPEEQHDSAEKEGVMIGGEILFERRPDDLSQDDWSGLRWMSTAGERTLRYCRQVTRTITRRGLFFGSEEQQVTRKIAIYEQPNLILVLRPPADEAEVRELLDLPNGAALGHGALTSFLIAETVIDPITCKLKLSQLTTVTSIGSTTQAKMTPIQRTCLELIAPTETVSLSALSPDQERDVMNGRSLIGGPAFFETASLERAIAESLYHAHSHHHAEADGKLDVAWKHQLVQGTLHSYVLSGNNAMLEKALKAAVNHESSGPTQYVRPSIIDAQDDSGRTALHYACLRKASVAVSLLTKAGASCTLPLHPGGFVPCHLSAMVLDDKSLSIILSATHPTRPSPNQLDALGRTPMYLAAVEGKDSVDGDREADSLGRCLSALEAWGGQITYDGPVILRNPVSVLASRWQPGEIAAVLAHVPFRHPLESAGLPPAKYGISVGASFQYPIHSALVTLRKRIQMGATAVESHDLQIDDRSPECALVGTLRVLLEHGFEPNERLEAITEDFDGARDLIEYTGYAPLQILASAALASLSLPDSVGAALKYSIAHMIAGAAELLVRCGGRLSLEPPPASRLTRSVSSISNNAASTERESVSKVLVDRESLKIDSNKTLIGLLGGEERLNEARDHWSQIKSVKATRHLTIHREVSKSNLDDSEAPGGSDEKSCAICWTKFGALRNRKHKCRVTLRYVCEDCSRKRVVDGKEDHRVSDGQFCLARVDAAREAADALAQEKEQARMRLEKARAIRLAAVTDEENRDSLFGGVMDKAANLVFGEEDRAENTSNHVDGLASTMNQTKDALLERGNKLTSLGEKTSQLVDSSHEFAKMAKELERQQKGGLFW